MHKILIALITVIFGQTTAWAWQVSSSCPFDQQIIYQTESDSEQESSAEKEEDKEAEEEDEEPECD